MTIAIPKATKLTPIERKQLQFSCGNRLNWTDSGNWSGTGKAPNCFIKDSLNNTLLIFIVFLLMHLLQNGI